MDAKTMGNLVGPFLTAYVYTTDPRTKNKLGEGIQNLLKHLSPTGNLEEDYRSFCEGLMSARVLLELIVFIANLLPGQPMVVKTNATAPIGETVFFIRDRTDPRRIAAVIYGTNPEGKVLVKAMVEAVRVKATQRREEQGSSSKAEEGQA